MEGLVLVVGALIFVIWLCYPKGRGEDPDVIKCERCGGPVVEDAPRCPHCGHHE